MRKIILFLIIVLVLSSLTYAKLQVGGDSLPSVIIGKSEKFCYLDKDNIFTGNNTFYNLTVINFDVYNITGYVNATGYVAGAELCINGVGCFSTLDISNFVNDLGYYNSPDNETDPDSLHLNQDNFYDDGWIVYNEAQTNFTFNQSKLATTYYNATSGINISGKIFGTINLTQHPDGNYDGLTFNITEVSGGPGLDLRVNFTNGIKSFNKGYIRYKTSSLSGDYPEIQLWDYDDEEWEGGYGYLSESDDFIQYTNDVLDSDSHLQDGTVQIRLYKASNGNTNNNYYVDMLAVVDGYATPSGNIDLTPYSRYSDYNTTEFNASNMVINLNLTWLKNLIYTNHSGEGYVKNNTDVSFLNITVGSINNMNISVSSNGSRTFVNYTFEGGTELVNATIWRYGTGTYDYKILDSNTPDVSINCGQNGVASDSTNNGYQCSAGNGEEGMMNLYIAPHDFIVRAIGIMPVTSTTTGTVFNFTINGESTLCAVNSSGVSQSAGSTASFTRTNCRDLEITGAAGDGIGIDTTVSDGNTNVYIGQMEIDWI